MITLAEFKQIDTEVSNSINETLDAIKNNCKDNNYVLLLCEGEYKPKIAGTPLNLSPYVIDDREGKMKDDPRINFWLDFLKKYYVFPNGTTEIDDDKYRIHLELMIYSHIWESEPLLKKLFRLTNLVSEGSYYWEVKVPEMGKHVFIRKNIREILIAKKLSLGDIIKKGFHTSLRNAFSHSQYSFNEYRKGIKLDNYKGESWEMDFITYNDWTKRFAYSFFLNYHLLNHIQVRRMSLIDDFGTNTFSIKHPTGSSIYKDRHIQYDSHRDAFIFL
jgi:hypothetical protein